MIFDLIENAHLYLTANKGFAQAFEFLTRSDLNTLPTEKYEIDSDRLYAMVAKEPGRRKENALLETHEQYMDIHLVLAGTDTMGWKTKSSCALPAGEYDPESDIQFFADEPDAWLPVTPGFFVIFFPEDAHMPLISIGQLHKVVVKVAVERE